MSLRLEDVNARAVGLSSRILPRETLEALAQARDLRELGRGLAAAGVLANEISSPTALALDLAQRRAAGRTLEVARRWLGARGEVLAVALDAEDRRSLRALVRGAAAGSRAEARLSGLVPTPSLPERLLEELASRARIREQAALLVTAGHPLGGPLLAAAAAEQPDLFAVELALDRAFAERALRGARRGGTWLREYVADLVDFSNCRTALLLARTPAEEPVSGAFLPGGHRLPRETFDRAAGAGDASSAARTLGPAMDGAVAELLERHANAPAALERALERHIAMRLRRAARLDPLGPAPFLLFCHRLREETMVLSRLIWSVELGVPAARRWLEGSAVA